MIINYNSIASADSDSDSIITVQDITEVRSEEGTLWEVQVVFEGIGDGDIVYYALTTGSTSVEVTRRVVTGAFEDITYRIYKGATISGGTAVAIGNLSDMNANSTQCSVVTDPTITDTGTLWAPEYRVLGSVVQGFTRATNVSYGSGHGVRVLAPNTTYLVEIENNESDNITAIAVDLSFYEPAT